MSIGAAVAICLLISLALSLCFFYICKCIHNYECRRDIIISDAI